MEASKLNQFVVAVLVIFTIFAVFGEAAVEDVGGIAPSPAMQSDGVSLHVSGLFAVVASLVAYLF
ncbi:hypothetical protein RND81_07G162200 [Saponaria officinalis]|uniref:Uncharacterized protein n=1 Tax=Saponaria officinalis TaxID=3572 RepID=A0AAW1JSE4_SAPOF